MGGGEEATPGWRHSFLGVGTGGDRAGLGTRAPPKKGTSGAPGWEEELTKLLSPASPTKERKKPVARC